MGVGMWMTSYPEAMGGGFGVIKKTVCWDSDLGKASRFSSLGEAWPVWSTRYATRGGVRWNSQHSKNCVSHSSCWKPKSQKGKRKFRTWTKESRQCFDCFSDSYPYERFIHPYISRNHIWLYHITRKRHTRIDDQRKNHPDPDPPTKKLTTPKKL